MLAIFRRVLSRHAPEKQRWINSPEALKGPEDRGRARTDRYWDLAQELYTKRGLDRYRWVNEEYL
jgi:hypothetical protein